MTPAGKAREGRRDEAQERRRATKPQADDPQPEVEPADFIEDDEVGPHGGYGGSGPDQSRPQR
jgi:hypothetical protein